MQELEIEAVYEPGILILPHELPLVERTAVRITRFTHRTRQRPVGLVPWKGDPEELDRWLNDPNKGHMGDRKS